MIFFKLDTNLVDRESRFPGDSLRVAGISNSNGTSNAEKVIEVG